jgi:hypothetical protein
MQKRASAQLKREKLFPAELMSWKNAYIKKYASEEEKLKIYELFVGELNCVLNVANMHNEMKITHNFCLAESIEMLRAAECGEEEGRKPLSRAESFTCKFGVSLLTPLMWSRRMFK